jgi:ferredoxin
MHTIRFEGKTAGAAECDRETALLAAGTKAGVALTHRCGGHARCGTCLVTVVSGGEHLSEKGTAETRVLQALRAEPDQRLACQTWARGDATIKY